MTTHDRRRVRNFICVVSFAASSTIIAVKPTRAAAEKAGRDYAARDTFGIPKCHTGIEVHENTNPAITAPYYDL